MATLLRWCPLLAHGLIWMPWAIPPVVGIVATICRISPCLHLDAGESPAPPTLRAPQSRMASLSGRFATRGNPPHPLRYAPHSVARLHCQGASLRGGIPRTPLRGLPRPRTPACCASRVPLRLAASVLAVTVCGMVVARLSREVTAIPP